MPYWRLVLSGKGFTVDVDSLTDEEIRVANAALDIMNEEERKSMKKAKK